MKKLTAVILLVLFALSLVSCGDNPAGTGTGQNGSLKNPVTAWWGIAEENGTATFVMEISSTNKIPVDAEFTVEFIKDGETLGKAGLSCYSMIPDKPYVVYLTDDTLKDTDDVKIKYTLVEEAYYTPAAVSVIKSEESDGYIDYDFSVEGNHNQTDISVVFLRDGKPVGIRTYTYINDKYSSWQCNAPENYTEARLYAVSY